MSAGDLKISEVKGDGGRVVVACGWAWSLGMVGSRLVEAGLA